jgi:ABC-type transport system substrate-binding protein
MGEEAERRPVATGPWKFVAHVRGDRIIYEEAMLPWLREYMPGVAIGATHTIAEVGPESGGMAPDPRAHGLP